LLHNETRVSIRANWCLLPRKFYLRRPEQVARALLGKVLVHTVNGEPLTGRIVETEAYLGEQDPAAHAAAGKTVRNAVLFGPAGHAYVYHIYGMHQCLNVSCLPAGTPGCVLLRALEPIAGIETMRRNRGLGAAEIAQIASGPGKLCQALGITRAEDNGRDFTDAAGPLRIVDDGFRCGEIATSSRIGITKAADLPLRFFLAGHGCVSGARRQK
jgi:DNA-3-methyladenine glycosylase